MRRLRASAGHDHRNRTRTAHARNNVRVAASLLAWLRDRGTSLSACAQADIDLWLAPAAACQARDFLLWPQPAATARPGHPGPRPPRRHRCHPGPAVRTGGPAAARRHPRPHRPAAGCLLLLYGQQLSRISAMTASQVTRRDSSVFVRLGQHDLPAPEPLAVILTELIRTGRSHTGTGSPADTPWLFPGGLPGQPITAARLGQRLRNLGIYAMANRRAALTDLAAQLPAAVLADLLHLSPRTAVHWARQAEQTGQATRQTLPGPAITSTDEYLPPNRQHSRYSTGRNNALYQFRRRRRPEGCADRRPARRPAHHDALRPRTQEPRPASQLHPGRLHGLRHLTAPVFPIPCFLYHRMHIPCDAWPGSTRWRSNPKSGPGWSA